MDKIGRSLIGNSAWLFLDRIIRLFVGLFVGVLVARYLGPANVGIWNYCIAIFTFFIIFPSLGLEYVVARELINRKGIEEKIVNTSIGLKFIGATIGIILSVVVMGIFKGFNNYLIPLIFILTSGYLFQSFDVIDYYYQSRLDQKKSVVARMIAFLLVSAYKYYLIQIQVPLIWFIAASTIEFAIASVGLLYSFRHSEIRLKFKLFDWEVAKSLLKDSLVFSINAFIVVIYYKVDQVMITELLGEFDNGIYSVAIRIYELAAFIPAILVSSYLPVITEKYKGDEAEFRTSLKHLYSIVTYLAFVFTMGAWLFGPWAMELLYGSEYEGSGEILQIVGLGFYFIFMGMATSNYLIVRNLKKFILFKSIIGLILNVGLNLWLIPKMGIIGAALASIVSNFVSTFLILGLRENHSHLALILSPFNISSLNDFSNTSIMKARLRKYLSKATLYGFDAFKLKKSVVGLSFYKKDLNELRRQKGNDSTFPFGDKKPILDEREETSGNMTGHYFHQDLYVARRIFKADPRNHLDIGSRTDGFVAHVASFRKIEVMDIRPQSIDLENITFRQADLMILPKDLIEKYDSISSLHVIEHFGLGRYGDPIDYYGHLKALDNIYKMLEKGGIFYFSTPIGIQRIEFNAHRIFSVAYLLSIFESKYKVERFSFVDDQGDFHENASLSEESISNKYNFNYGCGIFELRKL